VAMNTGGVRLSQVLDFDQSPGTAVGGDPVLVYNSDTVQVRPIIEVQLGTQAPPGVPQDITVQLTWDGVPQACPPSRNS